ncbi:condensation domain-containing protein [Spongiactinospora sp. 9N601]|uniref:condensation domain-containing protein n=1 Tax=Spongiactinospora sp. 9N601 TaxID=3375149 RepID=UPI0037B4B636
MSSPGGSGAGAEPGPSEDRDLAEAVAEYFRLELELARCDVHDSFFAMGGTSLAALRILAALRERYGVRLGLADVFDHPTPALLAGRLAAHGGTRDGDLREPHGQGRATRDSSERFPLAHNQEGFFEISKAAGDAPFFNIVGSLRFSGQVDPGAITAAVAEVARRQGALRMCFGEDGGRPVQWTTDAAPAVREVDLRPDGPARLRRLLTREQRTGFRLAEGPPVRFILARTGDRDWSLVWTAHHLIFDGVSNGILAEELAHAYQVRLGGQSPRAELTARYTDFALWQRDTLTGDRLADHLRALEETLSRPSMPIAPVPERGYMTRLSTFRIDRNATGGLRQVAARLDVSMFVLLVAAALGFVAGRGGGHGGGHVPRIGVQAANRSWPGSEALIGCFSNSLLVDGPAKPGDDPRHLADAAKAALTRALRHEEMPLELAMRLLTRRGADLTGRLPEFGLALQPGPRTRIHLSGGILEPVPVIIEGDYVDPTEFPLVVELFTRDGGFSGVSHHMVAAWPGDTHAQAMAELGAAIGRLAGTDTEGDSPACQARSHTIR